jgi:chromosome segregation ATPase
MSTDQERAAALKEQTAAALVAARTAMVSAVEASGDIDSVLEARLDEVKGLSRSAEQARDFEQAGRLAKTPAAFESATDDLRGALRGAARTADEFDARIRTNLGQIADIGDDLQRSSRALGDGKAFLDQLEQMPGQQDESTNALRQRLGSMERALGTATADVRGAESQLKSARQTAQRLMASSMSVDTSGQTSIAIDDTRAKLGSDLKAARNGLSGANQSLGDARPDAEQVARQSADLANAARAGLNPTPTSAQRTPSGSSESGLRHRVDGAGQAPTHER